MQNALSTSRALPAICVSRFSSGLRLLAVWLILFAVAAHAASQRDSGTVLITQASKTQWQKVYYSKKFTVAPVVIAGPATFDIQTGDATNYDPLTVRVRNVTTTSFEVQIDEWDYEDGTRSEELVSWLALEVGIHDVGGKKWEAGRKTGVTNTAVSVTLANPYTVAPLVLAQVDTVVNAKALITRVSSVATNSFQVRIRQQESDTAALSGESVSYVAVEAGTGTVDGKSYAAGSVASLDSGNYPFAYFSLPTGFTSHVVFAAAQTYNNAEPFALHRKRDQFQPDYVELQLHEDKSLDAETSHPSETVAYLAIAKSPGEEVAKIEFGSIDITQSAEATWFTETFAQSYTNPVVVFGPVSWKNSDPAMIRVRNVTATGFEYQLQEFVYEDGTHPLETVGYLVMEAGTYEIGGLRWTAGRKTGVTNAATTQSFSPAFSAAPVLFTQVATTAEATPTFERMSNVTTTGFTIQLDEEEAQNRTHSAETVHYIAIQPGSARFNLSGTIFQAGAGTVNNGTTGFTNINYSRKIALPVILGDILTRNDADPVVPRYTNSNYESLISLMAREETSLDSEITHAAETMSFLSLSTALDLDEDGMSDAWELANGLDPNSSADAALDPDGDGQSNVLEARWGTAPQTFDSAGTLTITADIPAAYEHNDTEAVTSGRVKITRTGGVVPATIYFTLSGSATVPGLTDSDYRTESTGGSTLTGSISLGFGTTTVYVMIEPIQDVLNEYPESATVTIAPDGTTTTSGRYTVGTPSSATVTINDATAIAAHEKLFVAYLTPVTGSSASGLGTMYLNGPNTQARISIQRDGLRGNQSNTYMRYGGNGSSSTELRANLGTGNLTNVLYNIPDPAYTVYTGPQIVDALYQLGARWLYCTLDTSYSAAELSGKWVAQEGSTTFTAPADPPAITALTGASLERDVTRFLTQATFGPKRADIDNLITSINTTFAGDRIAGFNKWIDDQLALPQTRLYDFAWAADAQEWDILGININTEPTYVQNNSPAYTNRRRAWWTVSTSAKDQLRQRAAFALSQIFVTSSVEGTVLAYHYGHCHYYDMLGSYATGNFRNLIEDVSKHPIMGQYLSSLKNRTIFSSNGVDGIANTDDDVVSINPDENYAREVMQLFTIGLVYRWLDGSLQLDSSNGQLKPTYNNADITNLAKVFTGWAFSKNNGNNGTTGARQNVIDNTSFTANTASRFHQSNWLNPMKNFDTVGTTPYHDKRTKLVLGQTISPGGTGQQDLTAALNILFNHPNVAPFISRELIQRFVTSNPSPGYIYRVAKKFENNGSGVRGDMKTVIKTILLDFEARTLSVAAGDRFGKQKEPIIRYTQLLRALGAHSTMLLSDMHNATDYSNSGVYPTTTTYSQLANFPSGQTLFRYPDTNTTLTQTPLAAPTVFNWYLPDYNPGGAIATNGLVAPEMQITTETTTIASINYHNTMSRGTGGQDVDELRGATDTTLDDVKIDMAALNAVYDGTSGTVADKTTAALDWLDTLLMAGDFKARYPAVTTPANPRNILIDAVAGMTDRTTTDSRMRELLYLVLATPSYIHQK
jgi:uncharacterized protein (DUF1800 family)